MDETRRTDEAPALRAGRLEGISLPDLLWALCRGGATGVLSLSRGEIRKSVCIEDGRIVFASSNDPDDRLGELFLKRGAITLDQLEDALHRMHTGKRLGTLLVEAGSLRPDELVDGVLSQVRSTVLDLFTWADGEYRFDEGPLPTDEVIKLEIKTPELLLRGIRGVRSFDRVRRSVGAAHQFYGLAGEASEILDGLRLTTGEDLLIARLQEGEASVESLCREVFLSNFEIYQALWGLKILGVVEERKGGSGEINEATLEGDLGEEGFGELLVRLGRENQTGVLYLSRKDLERTFHIRDGRCVFATSNVTDDGLVAYLLRRGVISLRDREETAKRLLSNKRVGTILRELGVIDDDDLHEMVRQQISEIVFDTFRWDDAHFTFVSGPLPSNEEITLEENLNRLVAVGVRRVTSWSRVQEGCGGLDTPLALLPSYLDVLDAMDAGPEEWEVLAGLKTVTTARRICRGSKLGAFRICQILWALRVLSAVETRPASELAEEQPVMVPDLAEGLGPRTIEVVDLDRGPREEEPAPLPPDPAPDERELSDDVGTISIPEEITPEWITEPARDESPGDLQAEEPEPPEEQAAPPEPESEPFSAEPAPPAEPPVAEIAAEEPAPFSAALDAEAGELSDEVAAPLEDGEVDLVPEPFVGETQILSRETVEASLQRDEGEEDEEDEDREEGAQLLEPRGVDSTQIIPREVVEGALSSAEEAGLAEEAGFADETGLADETGFAEETGLDEEVELDDETGEAAAVLFEPPVDLDRTIARFNTVQRLVYRTIRSEVGAGAVNFIRACFGELGPETVESLKGADLQADGSWDTEALRQAVVDGRIEDPWTEYQKLIEVEIELLRRHIGEARAAELERQVARVDETGARSV